MAFNNYQFDRFYARNRYNFLLANVNGFKNSSKQRELQDTMNRKEISIAALCETNFLSNDDLPTFEGYRSQYIAKK